MSWELAALGAAGIARAIRTRALSPVEVMEATLARIGRRNPSLNALVFLDPDGAMSAARAAEAAVMRGDPLGPLHGVPAAIKDLFDFKPGWPATFGGIRALRHTIAHWYCPFAERMEAAGAILVGKTNSPVMGLRGTCDNPLFGPTRNPFDTALNAGGSSGGSAAAVADGLLSLAEGTDAGGSIRIPAAWCGVVGLKPSWGRVPVAIRPNAFAGATPFVAEGPIARTVEDAALALGALAGPDPRDPFALPDSPDFVPALRRGVRGMRIAFSPAFDVFPVEPGIADCVARAVRAFEEAGAAVEEVRLGLRRSHDELSDAWARLMMPLNLGALDGVKAAGIDLLGAHAADFPPEYLHWIGIGERMGLRDLAAAEAIRTEVWDALQALFATHDLLVTPTLGAMPVPNAADGNTLGPASVNGVTVDRLIGWCLTYPVNFTGHPAASVPAGRVGGLPVGLQVIGRRGADADVLAASAAFERLRPWAESYATCAARPL